MGRGALCQEGKSAIGDFERVEIFCSQKCVASGTRSHVGLCFLSSCVCEPPDGKLGPTRDCTTQFPPSQKMRRGWKMLKEREAITKKCLVWMPCLRFHKPRFLSREQKLVREDSPSAPFLPAGPAWLFPWLPVMSRGHLACLPLGPCQGCISAEDSGCCVVQAAVESS